MKANYSLKLVNRFIEAINAKSWFVIALLSTLSAVLCIWSLGYFTFLISK